MRVLLVVALAGALFAQRADAAPCVITAGVLDVSNTCQLGGIVTVDTARVRSGGVIEVNPYVGGSKVATGNLELRARTITIDAGGRITARGSGYRTLLCGNGVGPTTAAGGRGGCSVRDSGGGGAHFGIGGRGTIDGPTVFPRDYEQNCSAPAVAAPNQGTGGRGVYVTYTGAMNQIAECRDADSSILGSTNCNNGAGGTPTAARDNLPNVNGLSYYHSIYQPEFGGSGGDKGCLDGDGKDPAAGGTSTGLMVGGNGGGRIVLAGVDPSATVATVTINGTVDANGKRGCGIGNDSGGGGAGGTVFVVGEQVNIGQTALITAAGGLGGDTQGLSTDPTGECALPFQQNQNADDCGGGGGGGIVSVLSVNATIDDRAVFNVNGAAGGVSTTCRGEAGGGVGELQISNSYVGEFCDGFDNDFDDQIDEGLGNLTCPGVMGTVPACMGGVPNQCPADVPACIEPVTDARARFAVILDTSGSMLGTLGAVPTFGDGSIDHPGRDFNANGLPDDSRLFKAKAALNQVIAGYPNIDFALARYYQDQLVNRSCQMAHNFECNAICCSYDNPVGNTGGMPTPSCTVNAGTGATMQNVLTQSGGDECVNYAGSCGPPRRGADVLVGFGADINNYLMWLDGSEVTSAVNLADTSIGSFCNFESGGDCELRGTGPTPLANSLNAVEDYLTPIKACDNASVLGCRKYGVILLTDGAESCQGNPVAAATALRAKGIDTYVIGFSTQPGEATQLNAIAAAGGTGTAFLVGSDDALANALAQIVSNSIVFETCNDLDDDCDTRIDEGFTKGAPCDNGQQGVCRRMGNTVCSGDGLGTVCDAPAITPGSEGTVCNSLDDDCDGKIDEGITGCTCIPQGETCNNMNDDCDAFIDEGITRPCGTGVCQGIETCAAGVFGGCTAPPAGTEVCNGIDDDCDGLSDGFVEACSDLAGTFPAGDPRNNPGTAGGVSPGCLAEGPAICLCHPGTKTCPANGSGTFGACTGEVGPVMETCNALDDDCDGVVDEGTEGGDCSTNCGVGTRACMNGVPVCTTVTAPNDDTCDGNDDDCDMMIDEDYMSPGSCGMGLVCNGMERCIGGMPTCVGDPIQPNESCNCADDDCDTRVDEMTNCPTGSTCTNCQCAFPCAGGEFPCPLGKKCENNFCVEDTCFGVDCPPVGGAEQTCVNGACVTSCSLVTCTGGTRCQPSTGECVPDTCTAFPEKCAASENCIAGVCVANPCAGVMCPTDQYCVGGSCYDSCAGVECADDQRCVLGECTADPCGGTCPSGQVCNDATGVCQPNPCTGAPLCPVGQWCDPRDNGQCVDDPCVGTTCPGAGEVCIDGTCDDPVPVGPDGGAAEPEHITAGGGGGCATGGSSSGLLVGLALLALRRRKQVRA